MRFARSALVLFFVGVLGVMALLAFRSSLPDETYLQFERAWRREVTAYQNPLPGTPDLKNLDGRLREQGLALGAPIFMRIFKREFELELWMLRDGRFMHFATYPICRWSGTLGPKFYEGDRQSPEGFYTVDQKALNPNSRWHRSFNIGYPNVFDRSYNRTGSFIMVHGGCGSVGCYAMTDPVITEIWQIVTAALNGGQARFQVQVFPFRMSQENLAARAAHPHTAFWQNLKAGHDLFEKEKRPPLVSVCNKTYQYKPAGTTIDGSTEINANCSS